MIGLWLASLLMNWLNEWLYNTLCSVVRLKGMKDLQNWIFGFLDILGAAQNAHDLRCQTYQELYSPQKNDTN